MFASGGNQHGQLNASGDQFDLLPSNEKCDTFKVVFDYYSPRPHFIIVPRDRKSITRYNSLAPGAKLKIVKAAMTMVSHYKLQKSATLSLHFGKWGSDKDKFHVHLCVDVEQYLSIYDTRKHEIPNWPSTRSVTKEWRACRNATHSSYVMNVRQYPFKTYFKQEVEAVRKYRRTAARTSTLGPSAIPSPPLTAILYHPSEPRVGFAVKNCVTARSAEARLRAQEAIIGFANQYNLTNIQAVSEDDGCHVCLVLDEKAHGFILEDSQFLVGYIQITGLKFYRDLCPQDKQDDWFYKFSSMEDYNVYT
ncbi:uncharacterized protein [Montipora capricornis]|uniref:uncharacterized protein n=1 Tax=Montipora capricornis TaxID=246305 RepID=UPI0035F1FFBD